MAEAEVWAPGTVGQSGHVGGGVVGGHCSPYLQREVESRAGRAKVWAHHAPVVW